MIPTQYASGGSQIAIPPALYNAGMSPGFTLGAQYWNWLIFHLTTELNAVLTAGGVTQNSSVDTQLLTSIQNLIKSGVPNVYSFATSQSPTAASLTGINFWQVTAAGPTTQDFSLGANANGVTIIVYNSGAGLCTVKLSASLSFTLSQGDQQSFVWNGTTWLSNDRADKFLVLSSGSPYTLTPFRFGTLILTAAPYTVNLPAATGSGYRVRIINGNAAAGLVTITPNGTDAIGPAGNVSCFLQNVDQSGAPFKFQSIELVDAVSGTWDVIGGQYCPHQAVDTDGSQYHLGKLHRLPLGNVTSRALSQISFSTTLNTWTAAQQVTGLVGVPAGAKGVRIRPHALLKATATGDVLGFICLSDNTGNTPTKQTAHPMAGIQRYLASANGITEEIGSEIDVPLNSAGQFYAYIFGVSNLVVINSYVEPIVVGYYMGD